MRDVASGIPCGIGPPAFPLSSPEGPLQKTDLELRSIFLCGEKGIGPPAFPMRLQRACLRSRNRRLSLLFLCCTFTCEQAHSEVCTQKNREIFISRFLGLAEREGFEPPNPLRSTVFKTAAFDHSAISPIPFWDCKSRNKSLFCKKIFHYFSEKNL